MELVGRRARPRDAVVCAAGCGQVGAGVRFVRDVRMPGVMLRANGVDGPTWFVCQGCVERRGLPRHCSRCGHGTAVMVGSVVRCAACGAAD